MGWEAAFGLPSLRWGDSLHRAANGLPRQLNNAATAALIAAATANHDLVDDTDARKAAAELTRD